MYALAGFSRLEMTKTSLGDPRSTSDHRGSKPGEVTAARLGRGWRKYQFPGVAYGRIIGI